MNKFLIAFAALVAVCHASVGPYGRRYGSSYSAPVVGGWAYQELPRATVQVLAPAPSYGSYGQSSYAPIALAPAPVYSSGPAYSSYSPVSNADVMRLAQQALSVSGYGASAPALASYAPSSYAPSSYGVQYAPSYSQAAVDKGSAASASAAASAVDAAINSAYAPSPAPVARY